MIRSAGAFQSPQHAVDSNELRSNTTAFAHQASWSTGISTPRPVPLSVRNTEQPSQPERQFSIR